MPKKNTVASLLAQSRNQRSTSPGGGGGYNSGNPTVSAPQAHAASNVSTTQASSAEMKAMKDNLVKFLIEFNSIFGCFYYYSGWIPFQALYSAMQELSNSKLSSAYLNGIKDSLNSGSQAASSDANHAIQDLLRAASLLGGFGFGAGPLSGLSQPASTQASGKSTSPTKGADGGSSKTEHNPASKTNETASNKSTPTPENGQARSAESHRGNGKSSHDDTPASDDSGKLIRLALTFSYLFI